MQTVDKILRPALSDLSPYNSGLSLADIQAKYDITQIAKLGSNENPFGPPPEVLVQMADAMRSVYLYPQSDAGELRKVLANYIGVDDELLVFGNGSEELISIISRTVIESNDRVITLYPSFPLHEDYVRLMGGDIERVTVTEDLTVDVPSLLEAVRKPAKMLIFANPMNPVGAWLNPIDLKTVLSETHPDTLIVLDEAYYEYACEADYVTGLDFLKPECRNWIILRTFSKAWGLAGLRIGYGICSSKVLRSALDLTRTPFNINTCAQMAALSALEKDGHMKHNVSLVNDARKSVRAQLERLGIHCAPSAGNFLFFDVRRSSTDFADELLKQGTIVKPWKQTGFETFIRASIGLEEENQQFLDSLKRIL